MSTAPSRSSGSYWSSLAHRWAPEAASRLAGERNRLFDDLAQFGKYGLLVIAVASTVEQAGTTADKAPVFVRPLDNLQVLNCLHSLLSLPNRRSDRLLRYAFASPPSRPASVTGLATCGCTKFRWLPRPPRFKKSVASNSLISSLSLRGTGGRRSSSWRLSPRGYRVKERLPHHPSSTASATSAPKLPARGLSRGVEMVVRVRPRVHGRRGGSTRCLGASRRYRQSGSTPCGTGRRPPD